MPFAVDDTVKAHAVKVKEPANIALRAKGGGVDPDLVAQLLQFVHQRGRAQPQPLLKEAP